MIDIDKIKSAEIIEDREEVMRRLREAPAAGTNPQTIVRQRDDGTVVIRKSAGLLGKMAPQMPGLERLQDLARQRSIPWKEGYENRVIGYWASDERPDGHGDIVRQSWDFTEFAKNPVLPYSHEWENPPIGNAINWEVLERAETDYKGPALYLLALFADAEDSVRADQIFRLIKSGFLRGGSVGFFSNTVIDVRDEKEREELGLGRHGFILDDNHLMEFSPTTIGANSGALTIMASASKTDLITPDDVDVMREMRRLEMRAADADPESWVKQDRDLCALAKTVFPKASFRKHEDYEAPLIERMEAAPTMTFRRLSDPTEIQLEDVAKSLEELACTVEIALAGLGQQLSDIRDIQESMLVSRSAEPREIETDAAGEAADDEEVDVGSSVVDELLAKLR